MVVASTQPWLLAYYYLLFLIIAADIGGPDVQELWVMDSFASVANTQSHTHVPSYRSISDIISAQALNMIKIHQYTLPPLARVSSAISSLPRH